MKMNKREFTSILALWLAFLVVCPFTCKAQESVTVKAVAASPDGTIRVEILQKGGEALYRVYKNDKLLVGESKLGVSFSFANFTKLTYSDQRIREIDEMYTLPSGKVNTYRNRCNELEITFDASLGRSIQVVFKVFNEGFAYRYCIDGKDSGTLRQELSEVAVNEYKISWSQKYNNYYETTYDRKNWMMTLAQAEGQGSPALVETTGGSYLLLTEAANEGSYATSRLMAEEATGCYRFQPEGNVTVRCPFESPWRVVLLGTMKEIVESVMVENLNRDSEQRDWSWVQPGRASWNWGGEDAENVISKDIAKKYVDMAASMGWEYFLLDDGWDGTRNGWNGVADTKDLIEYARKKSVGVLLWSHQNRFPADREEMHRILNEWKSWGIKGVKVDFWEGDTQETMKKYELFMEETARLELLVNLHGCTRPSGLRRRWPHLLTSEAVYGGEMYLGNRVMLQPSHNILLALTRNVVGAMDYTPGEFGTKWGAVSQFTSWAHQLALLSLYESGIQCYVDCPENYMNHIAASYLKDIPAAWDETRCLEASPESHVTLARRKGEEWYVASICNASRTLSLSLDFLDASRNYYAYIYKDGGCKAEIAFDYQEVNRQTVLAIPLLASGGVSIRLSVSDTLPKPWQMTLEAEEARTFGKKEVDSSGECSGNGFVSALGRGNKLQYSGVEIPEEGQYAVTFFYMSESSRNAYLKMKNGKEVNCSFPSSGGLTGKHLAFKTILVDLEKGANTFEIGNASELAPNIDRITLKKAKDKSSAVGECLNREESDIRIWTEGRMLNVTTTIPQAVCSLYSVEGQLLWTQRVGEGALTKTLLPNTLYMVRVTTEKETHSKKIMILEK